MPICQYCFAIVKVLLKKVTYLLTYLQIFEEAASTVTDHFTTLSG